jgi:4-hydroxy-tetrahydrodipicolinate reductase
MGKRIVKLAVGDENFELIGAVESAGHPDTGKDPAVLAGADDSDIKISDKYPENADAVIDFSSAAAVDKTLEYCVDNKTALVMGTTGLDDKQQQSVKDAAKQIPLLYGTNMSIGMNVLFSLVEKASSMLSDDYDVEIIEQHHRFKKDSPSGSALTLAERVCKPSNRDYPGCLQHGREGKDALRKKGNIGMHAVRAGDITGKHSVMFATLGENITLNHTATNRDNFAKGALKAAGWLKDQSPGHYSMADVLGID